MRHVPHVRPRGPVSLTCRTSGCVTSVRHVYRHSHGLLNCHVSRSARPAPCRVSCVSRTAASRVPLTARCLPLAVAGLTGVESAAPSVRPRPLERVRPPRPASPARPSPVLLPPRPCQTQPLANRPRPSQRLRPLPQNCTERHTTRTAEHTDTAKQHNCPIYSTPTYWCYSEYA